MLLFFLLVVEPRTLRGCVRHDRLGDLLLCGAAFKRATSEVVMEVIYALRCVWKDLGIVMQNGGKFCSPAFGTLQERHSRATSSGSMPVIATLSAELSREGRLLEELRDEISELVSRMDGDFGVMLWTCSPLKQISNILADNQVWVHCIFW